MTKNYLYLSTSTNESASLFQAAEPLESINHLIKQLTKQSVRFWILFSPEADPVAVAAALTIIATAEVAVGCTVFLNVTDSQR